MSLSMEEVSIEEELFRVYKRLPYVSGEEFLAEYPEKLARKKKFQKFKDEVGKIGELTAQKVNGKKCVYEITREIRDKGYSVTPDIIYRVLEAFREMGSIRVQMLKPPESVMEEKIHTTRPQVGVSREEVPEAAEVTAEEAAPEAAEEVPEAAEVTAEEAAPEAAEEVPEAAEVTAEEKVVEEGLAEMLDSIETAPSETKLSEASEKGTPVLEALLNMNQEIETAAIVTPDGYSVSFASREEVRLDELKVAASAAVIKSVSDKNLGYLKKGGTEQIMLYTDKGLIFLLPMGSDYLLTLTATEDAQLGTIIRDATWASKRAATELERTETST